MNKRILEIIEQSQFKDDRYALPDEQAAQVAQLVLVGVLDTLAELNINSCVLTTYDLGVAECVRDQLIKGLAQAWGVDYQHWPKGQRLFPVQTLGGR